MSKKTIFSIFLILVGVVFSLLIIFTYRMSGGNTAVTLFFLSAAILCIIIGSILAFSRLLDRSINPLVEELHKDIEDDIQDLKKRRFTNTHWMVLIVSLAVILFSFFIFRFHKVEALWGPVPVIVPTFIGMLALAWLIPRTRWFREAYEHTPMWIFLVPTIGFILSLWLGLAKTENMNVLRVNPVEPVSYNTYQPSWIVLQGAGDIGDSIFSVELPSCDGDACGYIFMVIALIILTLILVVGSAVIPHFWILSGSLLLGIMMLIAIHDLRLRPEPEVEPASDT